MRFIFTTIQLGCCENTSHNKTLKSFCCETKAAIFYDEGHLHGGRLPKGGRRALAGRPPQAASPTSRAASPTSTTDADSDSDGEVGGAWA